MFNFEPKTVLKPANIEITYDQTLMAITGVHMEHSIVCEDQPFLMFLHCLLTSYPEIKKRYPPGVLGFTLNGLSPEPNATLQNGDHLHFLVSQGSHTFH